MRQTRVAHVATVDLTHRFLLLPQLTALRDAGYDVTAISAPGPWVADIEAAGIRFIPWKNVTRTWDLAADLRAFRELARIFRRHRFDVVHTHSPKPGVLGRIAGRLTGVQTVVNTVHGLYATPEDRARRRVPVLFVEWLAARFSDLELYQSEEDLRWMRRLGLVPRHRARLLGNGIDLSRFDPTRADEAQVRSTREAFGAGSDDVLVGIVGRLVAEKGYREFFRAAERLRSRHPHVRFVALGDPEPDKADGITEAELAEAATHVAFAGWRTDIDVVLAALDVFVLPSWREGLPRSAIEAAAMGLPLVLTDIRGCREVAAGGGGILVPPHDADRLTEAIERLVVDPDERARRGGAARARASAAFDERCVLERLLAAYGDLVRPTEGVRVRPARPGDVAAMARLHCAALPTAFLPSLGEGFVRQLYLSLIALPSGVAAVAEDDQGVVGFAAGVPSVAGFYRSFLLRRGVLAALAAAPRLVRPKVLRRAWETARYPGEIGDLPDAELLAIAVDGRYRSSGIGRRLAAAVLDRLREGGAERVKVVAAADNVGAKRFYESLGFVHQATIEVHRGTPSNVWVIR